MNGGGATVRRWESQELPAVAAVVNPADESEEDEEEEKGLEEEKEEGTRCLSVLRDLEKPERCSPWRTDHIHPATHLLTLTPCQAVLSFTLSPLQRITCLVTLSATHPLCRTVLSPTLSPVHPITHPAKSHSYSHTLNNYEVLITTPVSLFLGNTVSLHAKLPCRRGEGEQGVVEWKVADSVAHGSRQPIRIIRVIASTRKTPLLEYQEGLCIAIEVDAVGLTPDTDTRRPLRPASTSSPGSDSVGFDLDDLLFWFTRSGEELLTEGH
ncbi:hypothetical protein E2C01_005438 [Portunus trituberculatus]|uniref:Uncharacterized protein n=1 Tax=Portunus trituberculatus TaxID=210409 RepID=A0A5B7CZ69_PORTR|nr:hypothetical protein [Portunus trituberculatus]